jgi:hypothetical protein
MASMSLFLSGPCQAGVAGLPLITKRTKRDLSSRGKLRKSKDAPLPIAGLMRWQCLEELE